LPLSSECVCTASETAGGSSMVSEQVSGVPFSGQKTEFSKLGSLHRCLFTDGCLRRDDLLRSCLLATVVVTHSSHLLRDIALPEQSDRRLLIALTRNAYPGIVFDYMSSHSRSKDSRFLPLLVGAPQLK